MQTILSYDKIVIGSSLEALMFAFIHDLPIFFSTPDYPFKFSFLDTSLNLSYLKIENKMRKLKTHANEIIVGAPKSLLWERLMFCLGVTNKTPTAHLCHSIRYNGDTISFMDEYHKIAEIEFNHCYYFGDQNCKGFVKTEAVEDRFMCYDWLYFSSGKKHNIDFIETGDNFVSKIWFYDELREGELALLKDACVVSILTKEQLQDFDYSETMSRFKAIHEMEKRGMKHRNSLIVNGKQHTVNIQAQHKKREIWRLNEEIYSADDRIEIAKYKEKDLYADLQNCKLANNRFLRLL